MRPRPLTKRTVAYQLCEEMNGQVMTAFFASLKDIGIEPEVLVTDDSSLYPKSLAAVWAKCRHQLCRFHWVKAINSEVMRGIRDYRESLPKPEKRSGPGRPSNKEIKKQQKAAAARSTRDEVRKGRFLLLTRPEEAKRRWAALVANTAYTACSYLAGALKPLSDEKKFDKVCVFLGYANLNSTSNEVERDNRGFRKRQNTHERLRDATSTQVMFDCRLLRAGAPRATERLRKRFGRLKSTETVNLEVEAMTA